MIFRFYATLTFVEQTLQIVWQNSIVLQNLINVQRLQLLGELSICRDDNENNYQNEEWESHFFRLWETTSLAFKSCKCAVMFTVARLQINWRNNVGVVKLYILSPRKQHMFRIRKFEKMNNKQVFSSLSSSDSNFCFIIAELWESWGVCWANRLKARCSIEHNYGWDDRNRSKILGIELIYHHTMTFPNVTFEF